MGVNCPEYNFEGMTKPCDETKKCIENAKKECRLFSMCDLSWKRPKIKPTQKQKYRKPLRGPCLKILPPNPKLLAELKESDDE